MEFTFDRDQDLIHFMDKALGYTLTGSTLEQCFFLCYGNGQNGKSTLLELMMQILGHDFVTPAKFSTFAESKFPDQASYDVATLAGARMVTVAEPRKAGRMNEELLKQITGGDMLKARQIYREPFAFHPECKLWFAMNNQPRIAGTDEGIWRRVRFIPFTQKIEKKIPEFHKVLFNSEGPGILNRLLRGVADWQKEGLQMPSTIAKATAEFREGQNVIQGYFDSCTLAGKNSYHARAGDLYARYRQWAEDNNEFVIRQNEFAEELARRGFTRRRSHEGFFTSVKFRWTL
jgi:putative DNA primase/helicase